MTHRAHDTDQGQFTIARDPRVSVGNCEVRVTRVDALKPGDMYVYHTSRSGKQAAALVIARERERYGAYAVTVIVRGTCRTYVSVGHSIVYSISLFEPACSIGAGGS